MRIQQERHLSITQIIVRRHTRGAEKESLFLPQNMQRQ